MTLGGDVPKSLSHLCRELEAQVIGEVRYMVKQGDVPRFLIIWYPNSMSKLKTTLQSLSSTQIWELSVTKFT